MGTPPWCGLLPLDILENPHFPRGYRVVSKSNSPTRYIGEWVNKSKFILTKLWDQVKKRSFLVEMIYDWIGWYSCTETSPKRTCLQQKSMIFFWKTSDFPLGHRKPHSPSGTWVGFQSKKSPLKTQNSLKSHPTSGNFKVPLSAGTTCGSNSSW